LIRLKYPSVPAMHSRSNDTAKNCEMSSSLRRRLRRSRDSANAAPMTISMSSPAAVRTSHRNPPDDDRATPRETLPPMRHPVTGSVTNADTTPPATITRAAASRRASNPPALPPRSPPAATSTPR